MKYRVVLISLLLAACSTTKNADGSTQVTLHLASAAKGLQQSLFPRAAVAVPEKPAAPVAQNWTEKELKNF